ncbi:MAG TPA: ATP-binding cassette domain-containing protein [Solirubrobacteraceae bacterium]|nr:ATP-binding cassette domain-containing protein [Solirubrobacteraceae bacterium]
MTALAESPHTGADVICAGLVHIYPGEDGPIVALRNLDLEVRAGEMLALLGPSGSGKSTLLAVLSGMLRPTAGKVLVAGHDMARLDEGGISRLRATDLALLLQDPLENLIPYATAVENLAFVQRGARRRRWSLRWTPDELIDTFGLAPLAARPVYQLSGGEQQKVAMASAVATSPRVLVADEPTTNLDAASRSAVIDGLRRAREISGATVIVATHDATTAAAFPRTMTIAHGAIGEEGRGGRRFAVVGRGGTVQLPSEVAALYPAGSLFRVVVTDSVVELRPETPSGGEGAPDAGDASDAEMPWEEQ